MDDVHKLACPFCGSEFFLSSSEGNLRVVLHITTERVPIIIEASKEIKDAERVNLQDFCCGACSWRGSVGMLVEARM